MNLVLNLSGLKLNQLSTLTINVDPLLNNTNLGSEKTPYVVEVNKWENKENSINKPIEIAVAPVAPKEEKALSFFKDGFWEKAKSIIIARQLQVSFRQLIQIYQIIRSSPEPWCTRAYIAEKQGNVKASSSTVWCLHILNKIGLIDTKPGNEVVSTTYYGKGYLHRILLDVNIDTTPDNTKARCAAGINLEYLKSEEILSLNKTLMNKCRNIGFRCVDIVYGAILSIPKGCKVSYHDLCKKTGYTYHTVGICARILHQMGKVFATGGIVECIDQEDKNKHAAGIDLSYFQEYRDANRLIQVCKVLSQLPEGDTYSAQEISMESGMSIGVVYNVLRRLLDIQVVGKVGVNAYYLLKKVEV